MVLVMYTLSATVDNNVIDEANLKISKLSYKWKIFTV